MIEADEFRKLLAVLETPEDRALLLTCANCAYYSRDLSDLRWSDVSLKHGTIVCERRKSNSGGYEGTIRGSVLGRQTIAALESHRKAQRQQYPESPYVFTADGSSGMHPNTIRRRFNEWLHLAKLGGEYRKKRESKTPIELRHLRDTALTVCARATTPDIRKAIAGHSFTAVDDAYLVTDNPYFVRPGAAAIEAYYFGTNQPKGRKGGTK